ncbi:MAG TPA: VWA domain-containing protein [Acidobacteriaceae bacterium]
MKLLRGFSTLFLFATSALSAQIQPDTSSPVFRVSTRVVVLDVVVRDRKGNLVTGLGKDGFSVTEDGVPQKIISFTATVPSHIPVPAMSAPTVTSTADLSKTGEAPVTLLVLDELNTPWSEMAAVRQALEKYLAAQPPIMAQPMELLFVGSNKFAVIQQFTQDRSSMQSALKKHFPASPFQLMLNDGSSQVVPRMSQTLGSLMQISEATANYPGRKNIIWVGHGFPSLSSAALDDDEAMQKIDDAIRKTTSAMLASRMTLNTIDPTLLSPAMTDNSGSEDETLTADNNGASLQEAGDVKFTALAPATGGRAFWLDNFIDKEIATSVAEGSTYYTLSYSPTNHSDDPKPLRKIHIIMRDPALTATTRTGYFAEPLNKTAETVKTASGLSELKFDLTAAALSNMSYNGLSVTVSRDPAQSGHATGSVVYDVAIGAGGLNWHPAGTANMAEVSIMVQSFSAKGKPLSNAVSEHNATSAAQPSELQTRSARFHVPVTVPPNAERIRFVVRDLFNGHVGTFDLNLRESR